MTALYTPVIPSNPSPKGEGSAGHFVNFSATYFFPYETRPTDFVNEVSAAYNGAAFQAPDPSQYFTAALDYRLEYWKEVTQNTGPPASTGTFLQRRSYQVKAKLSPGAPPDAVRTLVAFYYEGSYTSLANLKETGTITFSGNNVMPSDSVARHCQVAGNAVIIEPKPQPGTPTNPGGSSSITREHGHLIFMDVAMKLEANTAGVVGDFVKSAKAGSRVRHFVTPKKSDELPKPDLEFTIPNMSTNQFNTFFEWDTTGGQGGEPGTHVYQRKVKRDATGLTKLRLLTKIDHTVVDEIYVWVVWCDVPTVANGGITVGTAEFKVHTSPNIILGPSGPIELPPTPVGKKWVWKTYWNFKFVIKPSLICDLNNSERPDLEGLKNKEVPGGAHLHSTDPQNGPGDHAAKKWDVSRQMEVTIRNPDGIPKEKLQSTTPIWWGNQPREEDVPVPFPADPAEGNDDPISPDEDDNPYQVKSGDQLDHQQGELTSLDTPDFKVLNDWGVPGRRFGVEANFREFCRLEIAEQGRTTNRMWFRISDYILWHYYMTTIYNGSASEWEDVGSSTNLGHLNHGL